VVPCQPGVLDSIELMMAHVAAVQPWVKL
jgi:hypothetical protein